MKSNARGKDHTLAMKDRKIANLPVQEGRPRTYIALLLAGAWGDCSASTRTVVLAHRRRPLVVGLETISIRTQRSKYLRDGDPSLHNGKQCMNK